MRIIIAFVSGLLITAAFCLFFWLLSFVLDLLNIYVGLTISLVCMIVGFSIISYKIQKPHKKK